VVTKTKLGANIRCEPSKAAWQLWMFNLKPISLRNAVLILVEHGIDIEKIRPQLWKLKPGPRWSKNSKYFGKLNSIRERGRPVKWDLKTKVSLIQLVEKVKAELQAKTKNKISDAKALLYLLDEHKRRKRYGRQWPKHNLKAYQNQLSIARKSIPKNQ
jgi:hypothetical protein